jgi:PAS domain S-box-containing protein
MKILIIDPDISEVNEIRSLLLSITHDTFTISHAEKLSDAFNILTNEPWDIILLSIDLPGNQWLKTIKDLKIHAPEIPVIVIVPSGSEVLARDSIKEGAQDYLIKNEITSKYLLRTLRYAIEHRTVSSKFHRSNANLEILVTEKTSSLEETNARLKTENEIRKDRERKLRKANRLLKVMTECHQALDNSKSERELLTWICEVLVLTGKYPLVWAGYARENEKGIEPVADCGFANGSLETYTFVKDETEYGYGPGCTALSTGIPVVINQISRNKKFLHWREEAKKKKFDSMLGLPILRNEAETTKGVLLIYAQSGSAFDRDEVRILTQLARDLTFGIQALRTREAHNAADVALRDSEMFYRTLINTLPVGLSVIDEDGQLTFLSQKTCDLHGLPEAETVLGTRADNLISPEHREMAGKEFCEVLKGVPTPPPAEYQLVKIDGSTFWGEIRAAALRDICEQVTGVLVVTEDITKRKIAEIALQKAHDELEMRVRERTADLRLANTKLKDQIALGEKLLSDLHESDRLLKEKQSMLDYAERLAHIGSWVWDIKRGADDWSDEQFRIFGFEPRAIRPTWQTFIDMVHPEDVQDVRNAVKAALENKRIYDTVFRIVRRDGAIRYIHNIGEVRQDCNGDAAWMIGSAQDITEQRLAEEEQARMATITAQSDDAIICLNPDATIFSWNAGAEKIFGYSSTEAIGKNISVITPAKFKKEIEYTLENISPESSLNHSEILCKRKNRSHFYASVSMSPVRNDKNGIIGYIITAHDITDRKQLEKTIRDSEQKFRTLYETMAQGIIHIDPRGNVIESNPAAERILGFSHEQLARMMYNHPDWKVIHEDGSECRADQFPAMVALRTGKKVRDVLGIYNPEDQEYHWIIAHAIPEFKPGERIPYQVFMTFESISGHPPTTDKTVNMVNARSIS